MENLKFLIPEKYREKYDRILEVVGGICCMIMLLITIFLISLFG